MHVLAIGNQKGGTSKTTTAAVLGVVLSRAGQRVHLIDMDPQASLTSTFGLRDEDGFLYEAMTRRKKLPIYELAERLTLTPSSIDLGKGESEFLGQHGREFILKSCLEQTDLPDNAFVIIDCPPSLGVLAVNCLTAADKVVVVVQPGGFELRALVHLRETVSVLKERINPNLEILGAILTNANMRRGITEEVAREVGKLYPLLGVVRSDAQLLYATTDGNLLDLKKSNALEDYEQVGQKLREVLSV
jgi:chromosome partitioning protein